MICVVRKLGVAVADNSLPVLDSIVIKQKLKTSADGQYIALSDIAYARNAFNVEAEFEAADLAHDNVLFGVYSGAYIQVKNQYAIPYNTSRAGYFTIAANTLTTASINTADGGYKVGNESGNCSSIVTDTTTNTALKVFARGTAYNSTAGQLVLHKLTIKSGTNTHTLVPALVNNRACLYDADRGIAYYANSGELIAQ